MRDPLNDALHAILPALRERIDLGAPPAPEPAPQPEPEPQAPPTPRMSREEIESENERRARIAAERLLGS